MIVTLADKHWNMSREAADQLLAEAKKLMPFGVYAIQKNDEIILINERPGSVTQLKRLIRHLKEAGYKPYVSGI